MDEQLLNTITSIVRDFEQKHNLNIKIIEKTDIVGNHFSLETQLTEEEFKALNNELCYLFENLKKNIHYKTMVFVEDFNSTRTVTYIYSY